MTVLEQSREVVQRPMRGGIIDAKTTARIGTWNVRKLYQCGRLAQLLREFDNYRLDILGISEMRWTGSGKIISEEKTVIYSGGDEHHVRGVGLVLNKVAAKALISWTPVSDRIITARLQSRHAKTTIFQVYAPTDEAEDEEKDAFYDQLHDVFTSAPSHDIKILLGDMNAQIDSDRRGWEEVIGPHGSATTTSDNGDRFLSFCGINNVCIGNTYFAHKTIHKKTWRSPDGVTANEIDYISINQRWRSALRDVRVFRGADVGSDHHLLVATIKLKLKAMKMKTVTKPFDTAKLKDRATADQFRIELTNRFQLLEDSDNIEVQWAQFRETVAEVAEEVVGRRRGAQRQRWITDGTWALIDERKLKKRQRDQAKTEEEKEETTQEYQTLDRLVKRSCKMDRKGWLERKGNEAQEAADRGDARTLFRVVRDLTGARSGSNVPIKDKNGKVLASKEEQDGRWMEHFRETLNQPPPPSTFDFADAPPPTNLDVNMEDINTAEVMAAIRRLKNNKAPGIDQISAEMLKAGGDGAVRRIAKLLNACWNGECVPSDWRKGVIVKLPKKGNLADCNNWRGITLLSVPGKVFCIIILKRLQRAVDQALREEQAGFRSGRSCSEQIFALRNILEQCAEFQKPLVVNFIDFKKAFDSVHRESLWLIARSFGIPPRFIAIFKNLYRESSCCVQTDTGHTSFFGIETGVRQGCILSPFLFLLAMDFVMRRAMDHPKYGIAWEDTTRLTDLDFADDIVLLAENAKSLQEMTTSLEVEAAKVGLRISTEKTKTLAVNRKTLVRVSVGGETIGQVEQFTYLGSTIDKEGGTDADVKCRIGKAAAVFQRLRPIWTRRSIHTNTKLRLFNTIVIPSAIYACETWKGTKTVVNRLNVFQQRCLRRIFRITYHDHITNEEILRRAKTRSLGEVVVERRMQFAGHVLRLAETRHARTAMWWTPVRGKRGIGRPRNTWRRTFTEDLRAVNVNWDEAEAKAADRDHWKKLVALCAPLRGRT